MSRVTYRRIGQILRAIGAVAFLSSLGIVLSLSIYFASLPLAPDPAHGLIATYNNHGTIHYVPPHLRMILDWAFTATFCSFLIVAIGVYAVQKTDPKTDYR